MLRPAEREINTMRCLLIRHAFDILREAPRHWQFDPGENLWAAAIASRSNLPLHDAKLIGPDPRLLVSARPKIQLEITARAHQNVLRDEEAPIHHSDDPRRVLSIRELR